MNVESAERFFKDNRPKGIPGDAPPPDWDALARRASSLDSAQYPWRAVRDILLREHRRLGADAAALTAIEGIDADTIYVIAGQQAGLFGGPLYTVYKAMHAVRLAARLGEASHRRVIPLFWVASDDHDFAEVNHLGLRSRTGEPASVEYTPAEYREGMPVGDIVLDDGIGQAIAGMADRLGPGDRAERYVNLLRDSWRAGASWTDAFAGQLLGLFAGTGLVLFDPRWADAKDLFAGIMSRELADPEASASLVNETAEAAGARSVKNQAIRRPEGATNLFVESGGTRHLLRFDGAGFEAGGETSSRDEMTALLEHEPRRFSPGAALRPVCQDAVFPCAALVAGPGERRYLGQIAPLYELFGVDPSVIWPRASFTVIDPRMSRAADKEGIEPGRLFDDPGRLLSEFAAESLPATLAGELDSLGEEIDTRFDTLEHEIAVLDKSLVGALEKEKHRMHHIVEGIRGRAVKARKAALAVTERRISAASYALLPRGGPQERWFGYDALAPFLGAEAFARMIELTSPDEAFHRIIRL